MESTAKKQVRGKRTILASSMLLLGFVAPWTSAHAACEPTGDNDPAPVFSPPPVPGSQAPTGAAAQPPSLISDVNIVDEGELEVGQSTVNLLPDVCSVATDANNDELVWVLNNSATGDVDIDGVQFQLRFVGESQQLSIAADSSAPVGLRTVQLAIAEQAQLDQRTASVPFSIDVVALSSDLPPVDDDPIEPPVSPEEPVAPPEEPADPPEVPAMPEEVPADPEAPEESPADPIELPEAPAAPEEDPVESPEAPGTPEEVPADPIEPPEAPGTPEEAPVDPIEPPEAPGTPEDAPADPIEPPEAPGVPEEDPADPIEPPEAPGEPEEAPADPAAPEETPEDPIAPPEAPGGSEPPESPSVPDAPDVPESPNAPETPVVPDAPEAPSLPDVPTEEVPPANDDVDGSPNDSAESTTDTAPTALELVTESASLIELQWQPGQGFEATGYNVYRNGSYLNTVNESRFADTQVDAGNIYYYAVSAFNANGEISLLSDTLITLATDDSTLAQLSPPVAPPALITRQLPEGRGVLLTWATGSDDVAVEGYNVYRDGSYLGTSVGQLFFDRTASSNVHRYHIVAFDGDGNFSRINTSTARTEASGVASTDISDLYVDDVQAINSTAADPLWLVNTSGRVIIVQSEGQAVALWAAGATASATSVPFPSTDGNLRIHVIDRDSSEDDFAVSVTVDFNSVAPSLFLIDDDQLLGQ